MVAVETLGVSAQVKLVCSDIDTQVLDTARRGVYAADARGLSPERLRRHFLRGTGANAGFIRVKPELARLIDFRVFNLMSRDWSSLGEPFDIVFCRNVMIYFDAPPSARCSKASTAACETRRPAVRRPLREFHRLVGSLPPARQDDLRTRVTAPRTPAP
jgi:chemotaxis protein methyltransferase CheR